jgi:hypothetical protein
MRATYQWYLKQKPRKQDFAWEDALMEQVAAAAPTPAKRVRAPKTSAT